MQRIPDCILMRQRLRYMKFRPLPSSPWIIHANTKMFMQEL
jgi:hypothetical protein